MTQNFEKMLKEFRQKIDAIDRELLKNLSWRGALARKIGDLKKKKGIRVYSPEREKQIFDRLVTLNPGPYSEAALFAIFREVISATRALEEPIAVSYLGPEATFTHMAAVNHFGKSAAFVPETSITDVFTEVEKGSVDFGVVPVENSTEGVVNYTLDTMVDSDLKIIAEIVLPIAHHLVAVGQNLQDVQSLYSHPQAFAQCRDWLARHLPQVKIVETESTAEAAKRVTKLPRAAAVASRLAADIYGLNILSKNIQDSRKNFTRFLVIGNSSPAPSGKDKTSVVFVAKDRVGVLYKLLKPLADAGINMTKIESRPQKKRTWEYMFFVDIDGHIANKKMARALDKVAALCEFFKILGSYPKGL